MAIFSVNDEGELGLSEGARWVENNSGHRKLDESEIELIFNESKKNDGADSLWARNACDAYFKLKNLFGGLPGVHVDMTAFEIGAGERKYVHSFSVYANNLKAVDIYAGSVLSDCISTSGGFQFSNGESSSFKGLRIIFDRRSGESHKIALDDETWFDEDVGDFEKMKFYEYFGEMFEEFPDIDAFFEDGSLFCAVENEINEWCRDNGCYMSSLYSNLLSSLCRLICHMVVNDADTPPELAVLCNDGGVRICLKCDYFDPVDVELYLPVVLKIASNIHLEWGVRDGSEQASAEGDDDDSSRNDYDISVDVPIKWQRD